MDLIHELHDKIRSLQSQHDDLKKTIEHQERLIEKLQDDEIQLVRSKEDIIQAIKEEKETIATLQQEAISSECRIDSLKIKEENLSSSLQYMSQILINSCEHHTDKCNKCISSINHIRDTLKSGNFFFAQHQEAVENTRSVYEEYLGLKAKISADKDDAIQFAQEKLELEEARLAYTQSCIEELSTFSTGGHQPHTSNHSERSGAVSRYGNVDTRNSRRQMEKRHPSGALTSESAPIKPDREVYYDHNYSDSYDCAPTETVASTHFHRNEQQLISSLQRRITEVTVTRTTFEEAHESVEDTSAFYEQQYRPVELHLNEDNNSPQLLDSEYPENVDRRSPPERLQSPIQRTKPLDRWEHRYDSKDDSLPWYQSHKRRRVSFIADAGVGLPSYIDRTNKNSEISLHRRNLQYCTPQRPTLIGTEEVTQINRSDRQHQRMNNTLRPSNFLSGWNLLSAELSSEDG